MKTTFLSDPPLTTTGLAALLLLGLAAAPAQAQTYTLNTLVSFDGSNGAFPQASLTLSGGRLYGTTQNGGANGDGTVFSVPVGGGAPTILTSFDGGNGESPYGGLTVSADGSTLYGTTAVAGANAHGTVFSVPVAGGAPTTLATFNGNNGAFPFAGLTLSGGTLYGTTESGGASSYGTVFSIPVGGGAPTILTSFDGGNGGSSPYAGLTLSADRSTLYGTTEAGGINGAGTVFSVPVGGGALTTLARFTGSNGASPYAGLTLSGGRLYGTTRNGGANGDGTVFSVPVSGGTPTVLINFDGGNGEAPQSGLTLSADGGTLYGTTTSGGVNGGGGVFSVPVSGGTPTELFSFNGIDGLFPQSDLTLSADGILYGTTTFGGTNNDGFVFSLTPNAAPVPEASSVVSFGLLLLGGLGGTVLRARKRSAVR